MCITGAQLFKVTQRSVFLYSALFTADRRTAVKVMENLYPFILLQHYASHLVLIPYLLNYHMDLKSLKSSIHHDFLTSCHINYFFITKSVYLTDFSNRIYLCYCVCTVKGP